ncbi:O-methyltransferase [bacterium LRH843]|nr:O-methyltransferase [bacterium LRH843]
MIDQQVEDYLKSLIPARGEKIENMEAYALEHNVPIMDLVGMESLLQQMKLINPKRILEIGSAIGYSAIRMATTFPEAVIVTMERDEVRFEQALANISNLKLTNQIEVKFGDALELSETLESEPPFDVLFIDAAKGQYKRFLTMYGQFVKKGGVIFSDNVLFRGFVAKDVDDKRLRNLANKIHGYNEWLMSHQEYDTRILPVGDGLAVSIKK